MALKERDLREPVADWFRGQGYECAYERSFPSGYCDILAFRFAPRISRRIPDLLEAIAVELKMEDVGTAIWQARGYWRGGARTYVAMPLERCEKMRWATRDRFHESDIGLLSVRQEADVFGNKIGVWEATGYKDGIDGIQWMKKKLWRYLKRKGDEADNEKISAQEICPDA